MVLVGAATDPGTRYGTLNQDVVLWDELHDHATLKRHRWQQCYFSAVLDGHGMLGGWVGGLLFGALPGPCNVCVMVGTYIACRAPYMAPCPAAVQVRWRRRWRGGRSCSTCATRRCASASWQTSPSRHGAPPPAARTVPAAPARRPCCDWPRTFCTCRRLPPRGLLVGWDSSRPCRTSPSPALPPPPASPADAATTTTAPAGGGDADAGCF